MKFEIFKFTSVTSTNDIAIDLIKEKKENKPEGIDQHSDFQEVNNTSQETPQENEESLDEKDFLISQIEELKDKLLRAQAEVQNVRRVATKEITKARLFGIESLAKEFIVVGDNLQRALESCINNAEIKIIKEGLELTLRGFEGSLESAGINPFNPEGETFNPEKHEAISVLEDDKKKENTIIEVIQRGFTIQGRILRPAKVVVTKHSNKK